MFTAAKAKANIRKSRMKEYKKYLWLLHNEIKKSSAAGRHCLFWDCFKDKADKDIINYCKTVLLKEKYSVMINQYFEIYW